MTGLVILAAVLIAAVFYLVTGWHLAIRQLPRAWEVARREWSFDNSIRGSVKAQTVCVFLFWPLVLTVRAISGRLGLVADAGDPVTLAEKVAERDRHIADLERELGIRP